MLGFEFGTSSATRKTKEKHRKLIDICMDQHGCNFEESSNLCKESGGNLAIIANKEENMEATSLIKEISISFSISLNKIALIYGCPLTFKPQYIKQYKYSIIYFTVTI